ncbi:MAG: hypothetical protein NTV22_20420 [bacterium]|nr:hypothetical protein [bacterium]
MLLILFGLAVAPAHCIYGADISYVWEMAMVVTSTPPGTGRGTWCSPGPIVTSAYEYVLTTKVSAVAHLLPPLPGTWDAGEQAMATNIGALPPLPCVFFDDILRFTNVQSLLFLMVTSVASAHAQVTIGTDAYVRYEVSEFFVTNLTLHSATRVYVELSARTNEGRGIFLTAVPELLPWHAPAALSAVLICARRARPGGLPSA